MIRSCFAACFILLLAALTACQSPPAVPHGAGAAIDAKATGQAAGQEGEVVARPSDVKPGNVATVRPEPIQQATLKFDEIVRKGDRFLFVGDDLTQQSFYTRAFAIALLSIKPDYGLRFFNGGMDGATAQTAQTWVGELIDISKPTVVFICLGINDGKNLPPTDALIQSYEDHLSKLIDQVKSKEGVREVVVMSPPASQIGDVEGGNKGGYNLTLYRLALSAQGMAGIKKVKFVDLYEPMRVVYTEAAKLGGDMLTHNGKLPTEPGHTVLASVMLWGIGVTREQLEPAGWSPLRPPQMGRVRGALGLLLKAPDFRAATHSRQSYEKMREFDVLFFQAWRLARPDSKEIRNRAVLLEKAEVSWFELDTYVRSVYGGGTPGAVPEPVGKPPEAVPLKKQSDAGTGGG